MHSDIMIGSDVDSDPDSVGSGFIWVRGSGFRIRIQIQRFGITDKMKGKAEFNRQKSYFFAGNYSFQV